jgi:hypothetical protein
MALVLNDRVRETTIIVGTGTATLLGAATGYQSFSVVGNGNTTYYCISDQGGPNWEVGVGTYTSAGTTLARTTVLASSNGGGLVSFTAGTKDVFVTYPSEKGVWYDASGNVLFTGATTISVTDNTNAALRITQLGTGNALVVEDSTNPDSTPFVIDASGNVFKGATTSQTVVIPSGTQINGTGTDAYLQLGRWSANAANPGLIYGKSRGTSVGTRGLVASGDNLGEITFSGDDGASFIVAAIIQATVDGTPGTNDMPGRLVFSTTADGASSPTERMRIDNAGRVGIGSAPTTTANLYISKNITGGTTAFSVGNFGTVQSDVTSEARLFATAPTTAATTFTLSDLRHYVAFQGTFGAGSTVTNQSAFYVGANLTGATNNYGFYGNIAAGTGRYNLYMGGTADNYMAGSLGIGGTDARAMVNVGGSIVTGTGIEYFRAGGTLPATATAYVIPFHCEVSTPASATTFSELTSFKSQPATTGANSILSILNHFAAAGPSLGSGASITNQYGFASQVSLTGATNNYGFYGNIPSGTGRYNLYMAGTASNYLAGPLITAGLKATSAAAPTIASATTIAPTTQIAFISGTTAIATITAPSPISLGGGQITLIPTGIFTTTTAGNIALASTAVVGKALIMTYDATTTKWYPSY